MSISIYLKREFEVRGRLLNYVNKMLGSLGWKLVKEYQDSLLYIHQYEGGYQEYKETQVFYNKQKLDKIWADDTTLGFIASFLKKNLQRDICGVCHGARNGYEVEWFNQNLTGKTIGTDISETAKDYKDMVVWDFQEQNPEWEGKFDFVYSNSLDQAMDPQKALLSWSKQLKTDGYIFIEHTMAHSAEGASKMDPFGAHPMIMPYLFFEWGRGSYKMVDILHPPKKHNNQKEVWVFVLQRG